MHGAENMVPLSSSWPCVFFHAAASTSTFLFKLEARTSKGEWRRKIKAGISFLGVTPSTTHVPNLSYKLQLVKWAYWSNRAGLTDFN